MNVVLAGALALLELGMRGQQVQRDLRSMNFANRLCKCSQAREVSSEDNLVFAEHILSALCSWCLQLKLLRLMFGNVVPSGHSCRVKRPS
jgi:hypothetical protein